MNEDGQGQGQEQTGSGIETDRQGYEDGLETHVSSPRYVHFYSFYIFILIIVYT